MPIRIACPSCKAALSLPDSAQGKALKIACKKCGTSFTVGKKAAPGGPATPGAVRVGSPSAGRSAAPVENNDDLQFDSPNVSAKRSVDARRAPAKSGGRGWLLIGGIVAAVLAAGGGVLVAVLMHKPSTPEDKLVEGLKKELPSVDKDLKDFPKIDPKLPIDKLPPSKIDPPIPPDNKDDTPVKKELPPPNEPITHDLGVGVRHLDLSPDGKLLAVGWSRLANNGIKLFQYPDFKLVKEWNFEVGGQRGLAFSRDGKTVFALKSGVFPPNSVQAFDVETGKELGHVLNYNDRGDIFALSQDGSLIMAGGKQELKLWNVKTKSEVGSFKPSLDPGKNWAFLYDGLFTPDNKFLFIAQNDKSTGDNGQIRLWDPDSKMESVHIGEIRGLMKRMLRTRDGRILAVYHNTWDGGGVSCWDSAGKPLWFWKSPGVSGFMSTIALSKDEKLLAVAGNSSTIRVVDMADGKTLGGFTKATSQVDEILFTHDDKVVSGGFPSIKVWDLADLRPVDAPKDPVVAKGDPKKDVTPPKPVGPMAKTYGDATFRENTGKGKNYLVGGKILSVEVDNGSVFLDLKGMPVAQNHPYMGLFRIQENIVQLKVREEEGKKPYLLECRLTRIVNEIPAGRPGSFELKAARVKSFGSGTAILAGPDGKEHRAKLSFPTICYDRDSKCLDAPDAARVFKVGNTLDVWLSPINSTVASVNVAKLLTGDLMTDAELGKKGPPPMTARLEKRLGKLRVSNRGGKIEYRLGVNPGKGFVSLFLDLSKDPKAVDMDGKSVPWAMIFHDGNQLELNLETRGTIHTVLDARLVKGVVK